MNIAMKEINDKRKSKTRENQNFRRTRMQKTWNQRRRPNSPCLD